MLIEKSNVEVNDIVTIKLTSQEELIARLVAQDVDTITIQKPMVMTISLDERSGRPAIQMMPFFLLGAKQDARITLNRSHVIVLLLSNDEAKSGYIHNTSSLAVPTSGEKGLIL